MTVNTISKRVDVLLQVGTKQPKKWAKVHGYVEPQHEGLDWRTEWQLLRAHHLVETSFLFEIIDELVKRCNDRTSKTD